MPTYSKDVTIDIEGADILASATYEHQPAESVTFDCPGSDEELYITELTIPAYSDADASWMLENNTVYKSIMEQVKEVTP